MHTRATHAAQIQPLRRRRPSAEAAAEDREQGAAIRPTAADPLPRIRESIALARMNEAAALCRAALLDAPHDPAITRHLGYVLLMQGDFQAALAALNGIDDPGHEDGWLDICRGLAAMRAESEQAAIPYFRKALGDPSAAAQAREHLGLMLQATGSFEEARRCLEHAVIDRPDSAPAHAALGLALINLGEEDEGLQELARALDLSPDDLLIGWDLVCGHRLAGETGLAVDRLRRHLERQPASMDLKINLGRALAADGQFEEARGYLELAVHHYPGIAAFWEALGESRKQVDLAGAVDCYRHAVALTPDVPRLRFRLGTLLTQAGREDEAGELYRSCASCPDQAATAKAPDGRLRIAILLLEKRGNTPTHYLIDRYGFSVDRITLSELYDHPIEYIDRRYEVLFNSAADADMAAGTLKRLTAFTNRLSIPVLNPPEQIERTPRDRMAMRLRDIAGTHVPPVVRVRAAALLEAGPVGLGEEMGFPLLARPAGSHGGDMTRAGDWATLRAYLESSGAEELYLTSFVDFRSRDGVYRKFRVVFVDGELLPLHLSVSATWLNHYFRSLMPTHEAYRREEAAFLNDPRGFVGPKPWTALVEIGHRIGLDYYGVDFAIDREGRLLVFECNANMLVEMPLQAMYAYRRPHVQRIRDAVSAMLKQAARLQREPCDDERRQQDDDDSARRVGQQQDAENEVFRMRASVTANREFVHGTSSFG